jgi:hypothetical protein
MKEVQSKGEAFGPQKKTCSTSKHGICFFCGSFFPPESRSSRPKSSRSIRIRIHNTGRYLWDPVWRIRDVYPGSRIRLFSISDPGSSKNLSILTPKKAKKWFLSFKKYYPGCSSRIPDADFLPSRIPDPRSRGQKGTQSRIPDPDPQH